jgi:hypothetical protein
MHPMFSGCDISRYSSVIKSSVSVKIQTKSDLITDDLSIKGKNELLFWA